MEHRLEGFMLHDFQEYLVVQERSNATITKYLRDVGRFFHKYGEGSVIAKEQVIAYKKYLMEFYTAISVNSMLAALNCFFRFQGWSDCMIKMLPIQQEVFRNHEREMRKFEYLRLLETAKKKGRERLYLIMETLASTGIRIGELSFITIEAVKTGYAEVTLKRKTRQVLLSKKLCRKLFQYAKKRKIDKGSIFVTRRGKCVDRSNILHEMKGLCREAGVERRKVFPHNFRHLFACMFYQTYKDLGRLADLLGHSNVNTTRIYTCMSKAEHMCLIERLGIVS